MLKKHAGFTVCIQVCRFTCTIQIIKKSHKLKKKTREIICMSIVSARASINLVSMSKIVGTNTSRVSRAYMLG